MSYASLDRPFARIVCTYIIYNRACVRARIYMYMRMHLYPREFAFVYMHKCKRSFLRAFACVRLRACLREELIINAKCVCAQNISTRKRTLGSETFRMYYMSKYFPPYLVGFTNFNICRPVTANFKSI